MSGQFTRGIGSKAIGGGNRSAFGIGSEIKTLGLKIEGLPIRAYKLTLKG